MTKIWQNFYTVFQPYQRRVLVTLGLITIILLGKYVPVTGIPDEPPYNDFFWYPSIFHLAWSSWGYAVAAMTVFTLWRTALDRKMSVFANPFSKPVLYLTLILCLFFSAIASVNLGVPAPPAPLWNSLTMTFSFLAGTVVLIFLGYMIETYGVGYGFWITQTILNFGHISRDLSLLPKAISTGTFSHGFLLAQTIAIITVFALLIVITCLIQRDAPSNRLILLWTLLLADTLFYGVTQFFGLFIYMTGQTQLVAIFNPYNTIYYLGFYGLLLLFITLLWRGPRSFLFYCVLFITGASLFGLKAFDGFSSHYWQYFTWPLYYSIQPLESYALILMSLASCYCVTAMGDAQRMRRLQMKLPIKPSNLS